MWKWKNAERGPQFRKNKRVEHKYFNDSETNLPADTRVDP